MTAFLLIALGGAVGAATRFLIAGTIDARRPDRPWGILTVNVVGSFLLGITLPWAPPAVALCVGVGLCGALTTYSTVAADAWLALDGGHARRALLTVAATVLGSLTALVSGLALAGGL